MDDLHLTVRLQRHPDVRDKCLGDGLLATVAQARVPRGRLVKEAARVRGAAFAYVLGGAFGDVGNGAGAYAAAVLNTILQLLPNVQKELRDVSVCGAQDLPVQRVVGPYYVVTPVSHCLFEVVGTAVCFAEAL